ncbi:hypothetical protein [Pelagibius marinus]|uniref:hypothetical protein n=1 Tax=Pelagibius marinus TaxID=2762760 RepID=UPI0018727EA7|nr:hypothetical protein [Pelagibius marinus]
MPYAEIKNRLLRENDLSDEVRAFEKDSAPVWHIRRHVLPPKFDPNPINPERVLTGVRLGFDLLRAWSEDRRSVVAIHVSEPFLIVETEWFSGSPNAAPPEVYIFLAKEIELFKPLVHDEALPREFAAGAHGLDDRVAGTTTRFLAGEDEPDSGSWLFAVDQSAEDSKEI